MFVVLYLTGKYRIVPLPFIKKDKMTGKQQWGLVIINDHQFLSDLLGGLLKGQGFEPIKSCTGAETGLAYILATPPDLVIIDMMLPILRTRDNGTADLFHPYILMDTQTSFRTVKQISTECPKTKILILTGERHPHTFHLGFKAGAHGIASKAKTVRNSLSVINEKLKRPTASRPSKLPSRGARRLAHGTRRKLRTGVPMPE